jgi:hypothetical protein
MTMSLSFVSSAVLFLSMDGTLHNEKKTIESKEVKAVWGSQAEA